MKSKLPLEAGRIVLGAIFLALLVVPASAQISFVQVTDPHIFDDTYPEDSRPEDKAALASFINQINERVAAGANYSFVAVTGDLGIEELVSNIDLGNGELVKAHLGQGAKELAATLSQSKVKLWLFVPGNNDVLQEVPQNVIYYHQFMSLLASMLQDNGSGISVVDLCPPDAASLADKSISSSLLKKVGDYAFIGFNDSSFKNNVKSEKDKDPKSAAAKAKMLSLIKENYTAQKQYVAQVAAHFSRTDFKFAYIFYHVPEIDDPYLVTLKIKKNEVPARVTEESQKLTGNSYYYSAWFVEREIRDDWNRVVLDARLKGLFAGHFHDSQRKSYDSFEWMLTPSYLPESFAKLHVCPPLALKFQRDPDAQAKPEQARGFQEVYLGEDGSVSTRIFWLSKSGWGLSAEAAAAESQAARQFELGQYYENNQQPKEAEAAYQKAAESSWPPTRRRALVSLSHLLDKQDSRWERLEKNVAAPLRAGWSTGMSALGALLPALLLVSLLLIAAPIVNWIGKKRGRDKLRIGPIAGSPDKALGEVFEQVLTMRHGMLVVNYRSRPLLQGPQILPVLARSQSADVADIIETALPGVVGKVVVWLYKQSERPKYAISGGIHFSVLDSSEMFLVLYESGQSLKVGSFQSGTVDVIKRQRLLSFKILNYLIERMNRHG